MAAIGRVQKEHRYRCPGCGADLVYEPKGGVLSCPYCGRTELIPSSPTEVQERSYEEYLRFNEGQLGKLAANALEVACSGCGATVSFTPPEVAGECAFCGAKIVAQPKSADPLLTPEGLLPFQLTRDDATQAVSGWIATRWFAPNALKKFASHQGIDGIYLPFWTYDSDTTSHYSGERGEYYYVTESYTETDAQGNQVTKTRQVRRTHWYPASGVVERWFDDLLVPASTSLDKNRLRALEPWDLASLGGYDPAYLSGFKALRYQVDVAAGFEEAKVLMAEVIREDVRQDIGGDEQRIHSVATHYSGITFKHLLLPVYAGAYLFNKKIYQVVVNARSGEVQGERPYSVWKILLLVLAIAIVVGAIIYLTRGN